MDVLLCAGRWINLAELTHVVPSFDGDRCVQIDFFFTSGTSTTVIGAYAAVAWTWLIEHTHEALLLEVPDDEPAPIDETEPQDIVDGDEEGADPWATTQASSSSTHTRTRR